MEFYVYSRQMVEIIPHLTWPHAFISIRSPWDPNDVRLPTNDFTKGVLHLQFSDIDLVPTDLEEKGINPFEGATQIFTLDMGREVIRFMQPLVGVIETLVLHCDGGWSRSPGMAAAISKTLYGMDDSQFFKRYTPNRRVYRHVFEAYLETVPE